MGFCPGGILSWWDFVQVRFCPVGFRPGGILSGGFLSVHQGLLILLFKISEYGVYPSNINTNRFKRKYPMLTFAFNFVDYITFQYKTIRVHGKISDSNIFTDHF